MPDAFARVEHDLGHATRDLTRVEATPLLGVGRVDVSLSCGAHRLPRLPEERARRAVGRDVEAVAAETIAPSPRPEVDLGIGLRAAVLALAIAVLPEDASGLARRGVAQDLRDQMLVLGRCHSSRHRDHTDREPALVRVGEDRRHVGGAGCDRCEPAGLSHREPAADRQPVRLRAIALALPAFDLVELGEAADDLGAYRVVLRDEDAQALVQLFRPLRLDHSATLSNRCSRIKTYFKFFQST